MSVQVNQLTKLYGQQRAVDAVSFSIEAGEIVGFLGPNGAGKSTTMKMLTGYIAPTAGSAAVNGYDIVEQSLEVRRSIGYLPEHNPLYHEMYVREYLRFVAGIHHLKNAAKRTEQLIELTGLGLERKKKIGALSKGYRQRVGLAQALMHDPKVLILDEPTSGLDPNQIIEIRNLIKQVGQEKTVILSTHIMQEVQAMCSRVLIINRGQLVANAPAADLVGRLEGQYQIGVRFKNEVKKGDLMQLPHVVGAEYRSGQWLVTARQDLPVREALFQMAASTGNVVYDMGQQAQSLETVFQQLTRTTAP